MAEIVSGVNMDMLTALKFVQDFFEEQVEDYSDSDIPMNRLRRRDAERMLANINPVIQKAESR